MNLVISFTDEGEVLGNRICEFLESKHVRSSKYPGKIRVLVEQNWREVESIIFISSTGIAVRYIKDFIISKDIDPAIIVIDDMGKNVISLLSGHLGGGNELTIYLANELNSNPVITTATDNRGIESIDIYSQKHNLQIENIKDIKTISMLMLKGKVIGFYSDINVPIINYDYTRVVKFLEDISNLDGIIIISNKILDNISIPNIILRPKNIVVGIGCRKKMPKERIIEAIESELKKLGLSKLSLYKFGTVEAKKDEEGIFEGAKYFGVEVEVFENEEIAKVEEMFEKSQFVKDTIGVYSVSEPTCHLLGGRIISGKQKYNGITISIGEINL